MSGWVCFVPICQSLEIRCQVLRGNSNWTKLNHPLQSQLLPPSYLLAFIIKTQDRQRRIVVSNNTNFSWVSWQINFVCTALLPTNPKLDFGEVKSINSVYQVVHNGSLKWGMKRRPGSVRLVIKTIPRWIFLNRKNLNVVLFTLVCYL